MTPCGACRAGFLFDSEMWEKVRCGGSRGRYDSRMETVFRGLRAVGAALWSLLRYASLALYALNAPGIAAPGSSGDVRSFAPGISVSDAETRQTVTLTDDGSDSPTLNIFLPFQEGVSGIGFDRDYVNLPVDVGISFSTTNATTYPEGDAYSTLYPPENVVPLGPLLQFEFPYDAIKFNDDPARKVVIAVPALNPEYRGFFDPVDPLGVEVRIKRADGSESFSLEEYVAGGGIVIYKGAFDRAYGGNPPDIIRVGVQPVDYSGVRERRE